MEHYLQPKYISAAIITSALVTLVGVFLTMLEKVGIEGLTVGYVAPYAVLAVLYVIGGLPLGFSDRTYHVLLAVNTLIIHFMFWFDPIVHNNVITLFFVLSGFAALALPLVPAMLWIIFYYVSVLVAVAVTFGVGSIIGVISAGGGFLFFGMFGAILRLTNTASQKAQLLSEQLQETNKELRASRQQAEQLAVSEERNRLAREMHDSLGHRLTVAVVQLEGAQRLIPKDPERAASMIGDMRTQLKEGLGELRQTLSALRTSESGNLPAGTDLQTSIRDLASTFSKATNLPISLDLDANLPPLSELQQHTLYRAAQEGLTNIERHANASEGWVSLARENNNITLTVEDNGRGLPAKIPEGRFGLQGLRERAEQVGGHCAIEPRHPKGTRVTFKLAV